MSFKIKMFLNQISKSIRSNPFRLRMFKFKLWMETPRRNESGFWYYHQWDFEKYF